MKTSSTSRPAAACSIRTSAVQLFNCSIARLFCLCLLLPAANSFAHPPINNAYLWAKNVGSTSDDYGNSIAVDSSGNVRVTGYFYGTADFDPDSGTANLT